jgi:hypothetical protein
MDYLLLGLDLRHGKSYRKEAAKPQQEQRKTRLGFDNVDVMMQSISVGLWLIKPVEIRTLTERAQNKSHAKQTQLADWAWLDIDLMIGNQVVVSFGLGRWILKSDKVATTP